MAFTRAVAVAVERTRLPWPAKSVQASANKRKWMQINESKTAFVCFIYFSESGLFVGLQPIQINKTHLVSGALASRLKRASAIPFSAVMRERVGFADCVRYSIDSDFVE